MGKIAQDLRTRLYLNISLASLSLMGLSFALVRLFYFSHYESNFHNEKIYLFVLILTCAITLVVVFLLALTESTYVQASIKTTDTDLQLLEDIGKEIEQRKQRLMLIATVNLSIGLIFAILGLTLPLIIFSDIEKFDSSEKMKLVEFMSRSGYIVVFLTLSFFFFRIYRSIKEDVTYFINEKNNVLFKIAAYKIYLNNKENLNPETISKIITDLLSVDRNSRFGNGESNMRTKLLENEVSENNSWVQQFAKLIKND